jgi:hypothetical protein
MMTPEQHPITLPNEICAELLNSGKPFYEQLKKAARWGADQELEACCEWFQEFYKSESWVLRDLEYFRAARRPKPPSLKEQALAALEPIERSADAPVPTNRESLLLIRQALETIPNG